MERDNDKHIQREASELGLAPGTFPQFVTVDGLSYKRVEVERDRENAIVAVVYQTGEYKLTVFND